MEFGSERAVEVEVFGRRRVQVDRVGEDIWIGGRCVTVIDGQVSI